MSVSVDILRQAFEGKKLKNPRYSLRAFAKHLEIGSGRLSEFMNGQRQITESVARKISERLNLNEEEREIFLDAVRVEEQGEVYGKILQEEEFKFLMDPHYVALLSLIETKGFDHKTSTAANRLGISEIQAKEAIETLRKLSLLEVKSGKLCAKSRKTQTITEIPSEVLREGHKRRLKVVEKAIDEVPLALRDSSAMILAIDPKKLPEAKEKLKKMRRRFADYLETGTRSEVYMLAVHLVPMTK
ncbi:TIGR02147 family protein [Bdellovibrio svalbardensis]|uniref:DUF4423 domain-containing protein n=1 Tax=Bdellovibrio svalbardensis TaxID=2972972 RepID=A0ABT6DIL5_9BACT|nr:TIGR02147 family protein [Bdellovibrio svalbardensis]MDG0816080.1 DUF4423 domain-containing protein [Bdellovibrio svalbardensis]